MTNAIKNHWQLQEAKNKFSSLVEKAEKECPQIVTKHGKETVVIISIHEYEELTRPSTDLVKFFHNSPLAKCELELHRSKEKPREVEI
jgi:prevent-host-death family protein